MKDEHIWNLIGRQLAGEASQDELLEIDHWRQSHPDHQLLYQTICAYWQSRGSVPVSDARHMWRLLEQRMKLPISRDEKAERRPILWRFLKVAAMITLFLAVGIILLHYSEQIMYPFTATVKVNPKGTKSKLMLPDGSQVWLNADSELRYYQDFGVKEREVFLSGEAFFEVEKDPRLPFIIHLEKSHIQVLGTSFNVKAYDEDETVETSVVTGKVMFVKQANSPIQEDTAYYLTPDHKLTYSKTSGHIEKMKVESKEDVAWTQGKLVFKNASWLEIAKTLERNYDTKIVFEHEALKNCLLTATFQDKTLKETLELIAMTQEFDYEIEQSHIVITGKGCLTPAPH